MKLLTLTTSLTLFLLILSGCGGSPKPSAPESVIVDNSLPVVQLTKNGKIVGMKSVAFEWKSIQNPDVKGIYVYKKSPRLEGKSTLEYYKTIKSRFHTHFLDTDVEPDTRYSYAFKTFSDKGEGKRSREVVVNTLPVLDSVSWIHSITGMPRVAKIIWRPHSNEKVKAYVMERKTLEDEKWEKVETIKGRLNAEFIDEDLKYNYVYMYRLRAVTYDGLTSTPSKIVKVVTKALPIGIVNIKASRNIANRIDLSWSASKQKDFSRYYLYRAKKIDGKYKIIAKLYNNKFSDKIDENGKTYFYRVSAVDKDGLESIHNKASIQGMTLSQPEAPAIVEAKLQGNKIVISWSKTDPRSVSYLVTKQHKKGWFDENTENIDGIKGNEFIDTSIEPNSTYTYKIYSLDKNGIKSKSSVSVKIVTPESDKVITSPTEKETVETVKSVNTPVVTETTPVEDVIAPTEDLDLSGL